MSIALLREGDGLGRRLRSRLTKSGGVAVAALVGCVAAPLEPLEVAPVGAGSIRIERSCRIELGDELRASENDAGAVVIAADGVTVELSGVLRGAEPDRAGDTLTGVGIRVTGDDVTLRGARVAGYRVGIHAEGAHGLVLEDCDVSGNFRQRLLSTPEKEADEDWLDPHHNDGREWFTEYGAGIYVERSTGVTVRRCRARRGQNGLILDRCDEARVYDNDFSYLSGWGIALWRSSDNVIARNVCDFCVRGYVHGVYNRGQDSAGILLFEQCSRNLIAENSANYCGDGLFGFAGQEALGSAPAPTGDFDLTGRGCNENVIVDNDFSYAAAHGLELTFSFGNQIASNRMQGNAICGIWAGYSRDTLIVGNQFTRNGDAGYGLERGGLNIEHGQRNRIVNNGFRKNACGVHLWWDPDEHLADLPWTRANGHAMRDNCVQGNLFDGDELALHLRDAPGTRVWDNEIRRSVGERVRATPGSEPIEELCFEGDSIDHPPLPEGPLERVITRELAAGRERIRIDEWGPIEP